MTVPKKTRIESDVSSSTNSLKLEVALGWDFLGFFHFGLDQKSPGMGIGDWGSPKITEKSPIKIPIPRMGIRDF